MYACAQNFINYLVSKNLNYSTHEDSRGDVVVDLPFKGKTAKCFFSGENGRYFSLYIVYERVPADKLVDILFVCNELNKNYKWATFYIDGDNDIIIHDDAILTPETADSEAIELILRMLNIADEAKPMIMKALYA